MRLFSKVFIFLLAIWLVSCSSKKHDTDSFSLEESSAPQRMVVTEKASERVDLTTKGVGPVKSVSLATDIDEQLALSGKELFQTSCTVCHKIGEKFIGPPPNGILDRRTPEWIMNMILNPERMVKEDDLAKDLFMEFNGTPMANQGLTEQQARSILEYFRTL